MSPPLNLHSYNDQVPFIGPCYLPKFWGEKPTTKTNLQKPPITPCGHSRGYQYPSFENKGEDVHYYSRVPVLVCLAKNPSISWIRLATSKNVFKLFDC